MITVVHCKRARYTHYIGRGPDDIGLSNPYSFKPSNMLKVVRVQTLQDALDSYEKYARTTPKVRRLIASLPPDAVLGCWCANENVCHGGIIKKIWGEIHDLV